MPTVFADRVKQSTTTTGTGTVTLSGTSTGFRTFSSVFSDGEEVYYLIVGTSEWETGQGTYSSDTLSRDTVLASSNSNSLVDFSAGTKTVLVTAPASFITTARSAKDIVVTAGEDIAPRGTDWGYFAGGLTTFSSGVAATADKLVFSTDTTAAQVSANLSQARVHPGGVSEGTTKGYFAGGNTTGGTDNVVTADKIVFATDTTAVQTSANLSQAKAGMASCSDGSTKGYFAGGNTAGTYVATADKTIYATDTTAAQSTANLSQARTGLRGCSDGSSKGFFAGGVSTSVLATADKITFSTDVTAVQTSANLSQARARPVSCSEGLSKGYFAGGDSTNSSNFVITADKTVFATEMTAAQSSANLSQAKDSAAGCSEGSTKGYFAGGATSASVVVATADKITFSNDTTTAQTTANLTQARRLPAGIGSDTGRGPACVYISSIDGKAYKATARAASSLTNTLGFATESATSNNPILVRMIGVVTGFVNLTAGRIQYLGDADGRVTDTPTTNLVPVAISLSTSTAYLGNIGLQNRTYYSGLKGYCGGGQSATTPTRVATTDQTIFATDVTLAQTSANISSNRDMLVGLARFNHKGYFSGGSTGAVVATTDALTFSSDTTVAQTSSNLRTARRELASVSERSAKGYFVGGFTTAAVATGEKIVFSTETITSPGSTNLSQVRAGSAGLTQGSYKGYFLGGYTGSNVEVTTGDIIWFANDTTSAKTTANTAANRSHMAAFSEGVDKGWTCGGQSGAAVQVTSIYRMTFVNDSLSAAITPVLSTGRWGSGCFSEGVVKGYIVGGRSSAELATADVFKMAPETITATATANLSTVRSHVGSFGDTAL